MQLAAGYQRFIFSKLQYLLVSIRPIDLICHWIFLQLSRLIKGRFSIMKWLYKTFLYKKYIDFNLVLWYNKCMVYFYAWNYTHTADLPDSCNNEQLWRNKSTTSKACGRVNLYVVIWYYSGKSIFCSCLKKQGTVF